MDSNIQNNSKRIDFIPLPNEEAYWNCVGEITTVFSLGLLEGKEDLETAKDIIFYAWDRGRDAYGLSDALRKGDVKKVITIFAETAWDTGKEVFKLTGRKLVGKVMSYIKMAYSVLKAAKAEGRFMGCGEVLPRAWETLKEIPRIIWEKVKAAGENIYFFIVDSPADIIVEDSGGNVTSIVGGVVTEGIENSFGIEFEGHKAIFIVGNDVYTLKVRGTGPGRCEVTVIKPDPEGNLVSVAYKDVPTEENSEASLAVAQDLTDYRLSLDRDGDGTVDEVKAPDTVEGATPPTGGALRDENVYAYPNPFDPEKETVKIRFSLSKSANVTVKLYDASGRLVTTLTEDEYMEAKQEQSLPWDGKNDKGDIVANGVYFYVITTDGGERAVCKVAVLR